MNPKTMQAPPDFGSWLEETTRALKERFRLPSISVSATVGGKDYHTACGLGDLEAGHPATPDSIYAIGSTTKAFMATAICILAEEKKLELDAPVRKYLPDFAMADPYMNEHMTVRDILCHRCGLPRHDLTMFNNPDFTLEDFVHSIRYLEPAFPPRTRFHYQNHMFMLATVLCEKVSGMDWQEFVKVRILAPLGMNATYPVGDQVPESPRKTRPYEERDGEIRRMDYNYIPSVAGAGTIYSSTSDVLKWIKFRLNGDEKILSHSLLEEMHRPQMIIGPGDMSVSFKEIDFTSYGMGWFVESYGGAKVVHHGGAIDGFRSMAGFLPDLGIGVSVLANHNTTFAGNALLYDMIDKLLGLPPMDWSGRYLEFARQAEEANRKALEEHRQKVRPQSSLSAADYLGKYRHPAYGLMEVFEKEGKPFVRAMGRETALHPAGEDAFVLFFDFLETTCDVGFDVAFEREAGVVKTLLIPLDGTLTTPIPFRRS